MSGHVEYSSVNGTGFVTLCNPPYNILTKGMIEELANLADFSRTPGIKSIIIKGAGRHFCSGAEDNNIAISDLNEIFGKILYCELPVAAAIRGACINAGFFLAAHCLFRFASGHALLGICHTSEPTSGSIACHDPVCSAWHEGNISAKSCLTYSGKSGIEDILKAGIVNGNSALDYGFAHKTAPSSRIENDAVEFLHTLTANRKEYIVRAVMQSISNTMKIPLEAALAVESRLFNDAVFITAHGINND